MSILEIVTTVRSEDHEYELKSEHEYVRESRKVTMANAVDKHKSLFKNVINWNSDNMIVKNGCGNQKAFRDVHGDTHFTPWRSWSRSNDGPEGTSFKSVIISLVKDKDGILHYRSDDVKYHTKEEHDINFGRNPIEIDVKITALGKAGEEKHKEDFFCTQCGRNYLHKEMSNVATYTWPLLDKEAICREQDDDR